MFEKLSVRYRLTIGFGTLLGALLMLSSLSLWGMRELRASTTEINSKRLPSVEVLAKLNTAKSDFRIYELRHMLSSGSVCRWNQQTEGQNTATERQDRAATPTDA